MEVELTILKSPLESADELAAKDFAQDFLGQEVVFSCVDPTGVIGKEAARGDDTMNVRVKIELLAPAMQDTHGSKKRADSFCAVRTISLSTVVRARFVLCACECAWEFTRKKMRNRAKAKGEVSDHCRIAIRRIGSISRTRQGVSLFPAL